MSQPLYSYLDLSSLNSEIVSFQFNLSIYSEGMSVIKDAMISVTYFKCVYFLVCNPISKMEFQWPKGFSEW